MTCKTSKLAQGRAAWQAPQPDQAIVETVKAFMQRVAGIDIGCCRHCGHGRMQFIEAMMPHRTACQATGPPS